MYCTALFQHPTPCFPEITSRTAPQRQIGTAFESSQHIFEKPTVESETLPMSPSLSFFRSSYQGVLNVSIVLETKTNIIRPWITLSAGYSPASSNRVVADIACACIFIATALPDFTISMSWGSPPLGIRFGFSGFRKSYISVVHNGLCRRAVLCCE